ncbi:MAG: LacI family transcriptional regulator [Candidatus Goldbacteria bacterium]|nr:LacI family transcriptional regulator [Candidatus Goldiibacteriota bacterium]
MKKLVIKDIARRAGVSESAVSKVINNYDDISEKTKEKIQKIIEKLNYRPSKSAQILRKGKTNTIAFMSGRIASHFTVEILSAIERNTFITGKYVHGIIPYSTNYEKEKMYEIFDKILYGRETDAVIALAMNPDLKIITKYKKAKVPLILIENDMKDAHSVNIDNHKAGFMAAEYLIKKGRKKIGLICGGLQEGTRFGYSYAAEQRKAGFEAALKKYGIKFDNRYLELCEHYTIEEGMELFENFIKKGIKLDAIFCASGDNTAVGVMDKAKKYGMKIPNDLAVVGFDDLMYAAFFNPPLTTIRQPIDKIGSAVLNTAIEAIDKKLKSFKHIIIEPELIIRSSA